MLRQGQHRLRTALERCYRRAQRFGASVARRETLRRLRFDVYLKGANPGSTPSSARAVSPPFDRPQLGCGGWLALGGRARAMGSGE